MTLRKDFTFLRSLPWLTSRILQDLDPYPEREPVVDLLVKAIADYEAQLYCGQRSTEWYESLLDATHIDQVDTRKTTFASRGVWNVLLYRLLDVTAWVKCEMPIPLDIDRCFVPMLDLPASDWSALTTDWVKFMTRASKTSRAHLIANSPLITSVTGSFLPSHLVTIYWRSSKIRVNKFLINIEVAALFLSYILKGHLDFPETIGDLAKELLCDPAELGNFTKRYGIQGLRLPLQLALAVSPCALFLDTCLHKRPLDRLALLRIWEGLGSSRPGSLVLIKRALWSAIFAIAGGANVLSILTDTLQTVEEHLAVAGATEDVRFFGSSNEVEPQGAPQDVVGSAAIPQPNAVTDDSVYQGEQDMDLSSPTTSLFGEDEPGSEKLSGSNIPASAASTEPMDLDIPPGEELEMGRSPGNVEPAERVAVSPPSGANAMDVDSAPTIPIPEPHEVIPTIAVSHAKGKGKAYQVDEVRRSNRQKSTLPAIKSIITSPHPVAKSKRWDAYGSAENPIDLSARCVAGVIVQLIDLTEEHNEPLPKTLVNPVSERRKITSAARTLLYDHLGGYEVHRAEMHRRSDLDWYARLHNRVTANYVDDLPKHIKDPDASAFHILDAIQFSSLSAAQVQVIFATKHILVYGLVDRELGFDEKGLLTLSPPNRTFSIQDHSIEVDEDQNVRMREGTTVELLEAHRAAQGKILNALDFPSPYAPNPPTSIASNYMAWKRTNSKPGCSQEFPGSSSKWGLAATTGAYHGFHIDCDGFATYIDCVAGSKWWVVACPEEGGEQVDFACIDQLFDYASTEGAGGPVYNLEAVLLKPGTRLYMRPNTPHTVLTVDAAICHGGHLYASSTLADTNYGFFSTFAGSSLLTNTQHTSDAQLILRRMMAHFHHVYLQENRGGPLERQVAHIPDVREPLGLLNLLSICNLLEASNILHHGTYMPGGLQAAERMEMIQGRVWAREILAWLFDQYELEGSITLRALYWKYLVHQLKTLCLAKQCAENRSVFSFNGEAICQQVKDLVAQSFVGVAEFWEEWNQGEGGEFHARNACECSDADDDEQEGAIMLNMKSLCWSMEWTYKARVRAAAAQVGNDLDFSRPPGYTSDDFEWAMPKDDEQNEAGSEESDESEEDEDDPPVGQAPLSTRQRKRQKTH